MVNTIPELADATLQFQVDGAERDDRAGYHLAGDSRFQELAVDVGAVRGARLRHHEELAVALHDPRVRATHRARLVEPSEIDLRHAADRGVGPADAGFDDVRQLDRGYITVNQ